MIIYKTVNLVNGKIYIGQDSNNNSEYLGSGLLLNRAIEKYGIENFEKNILEQCNTRDELNEREKYWIKKLGSLDREIGYNISTGGSGGDNFTNNPNKEEIREKLSGDNSAAKRCLSGRTWEDIYGEEGAEVIREKQRVSHTGYKQSDETIKKRTKHYIGKPRPQWVRDKISKSHTGKKLSKETIEKIVEYRIGKTYEEIYGVDKANKIKDNLRVRYTGSNNPNSKLSNEDVVLIRSIYRSRDINGKLITYAKLADMFNVSDNTIIGVIKGYTYKNVIIEENK